MKEKSKISVKQPEKLAKISLNPYIAEPIVKPIETIP